MAGKALIIGGGIGGMCCAITLGRIGCAVDLIDIDPTWRAVGAGLTIGGPALRAFRQMGILDEVAQAGFLSSRGRMVSWDGRVLSDNALPQMPDGLPVVGGIMRPVLHHLLAERIRAGSADVRLGLSVTALHDDGAGVDAVFSDGSARRYDFVLGADSLMSATRRMIFPAAPVPRFTGQGCWRLVVPKPADILGPVACHDGPYPMGLNPVSQTHFYMYLLSHEPDNRFIPQETQLGELRGMLAGAGGIFGEIRAQMDDSYLVNYRPLEALLLPRPWSVGRVLLVGDAAHATTPHIGFGAGLAVEDAVVIAQEMTRDHDPVAAFARFTERRFERAKFVIETSVHLGDLEMAGQSDERIRLGMQAQQVLQQAI